MKFQVVPLNTLHPDPENPRAHGEADIQFIMASIKEFGWTNPLIVQEGTNRIVAGHGRSEAAKRMGIEQVPAVFVSLTELQAETYTITDNRSAELSSWDSEKLKVRLQKLAKEAMDLTLTGYDEAHLRKLLREQVYGDKEEKDVSQHAAMEIQPFEHHDYLVFVFKDQRDFQAVCEQYGIKEVNAGQPGGRAKIGLARVLCGRRLLKQEVQAGDCDVRTSQVMADYAMEEKARKA